MHVEHPEHQHFIRFLSAAAMQTNEIKQSDVYMLGKGPMLSTETAQTNN